MDYEIKKLKNFAHPLIFAPKIIDIDGGLAGSLMIEHLIPRPLTWIASTRIIRSAETGINSPAVSGQCLPIVLNRGKSFNLRI